MNNTLSGNPTQSSFADYVRWLLQCFDTLCSLLTPSVLIAQRLVHPRDEKPPSSSRAVTVLYSAVVIYIFRRRRLQCFLTRRSCSAKRARGI